MNACHECGAATRWPTCNACVAVRISTYAPLHPMRHIIAKQRRLVAYEDYCDVHGMTSIATQGQKCQKCHAPAATTDSRKARRIARIQGEKTFLAACSGCGETAHSVKHGKCLTCFNALGYPRPA